MNSLKGKVAVVTGASSGFGEAIAKAFAGAGAALALGARRVDRLEALAKTLKGSEIFTHSLDVRDKTSVSKFVKLAHEKFGRMDILVNNAGLALGREALIDSHEEDWVQMMDTNYFGTLRMTQEILKHMLPKKEGHIVNIGSIAGHFAYEGGGGYCGSKFAVDAFAQSLRLETVEHNIRITNVDPGMAETEFGVVRFKGDAARAKAVYAGMKPLTAQDVAECVLFAVTRPPHVNIDDILLTPTAQAGVNKVFRQKS